MGNKILLAVRGFDELQESAVREKLNEQGAEIESIVAVHTKTGVLQACMEDAQIQAAVISEYLESGSPYKPEEFDEVDAIREGLRVIPILMNEHRGKKYAEELHALAIYNAIFEENADMATMADLIKNGRNKKAARLYYGIQKNFGETADSAWEFQEQKDDKSTENMQGTDRIRERALHNGKKEAKGQEESSGRLKEPGKEIPLLRPFSFFPRGKNINYVEEKKIIGVIGGGRSSGSTMLSVQLARRLSQSEVYDPALIQFPDTEDVLSKYLLEMKGFQENYLPFGEYADPQGKIPTKANCQGGVRYIFGQKEGQEKRWSYVKTVKMLNTAGTPCILDFGSQYRKHFYLDTLKDCHAVIAVLDGAKGPDMEEVKRIQTDFENSNIGKLIFVVNRDGTNRKWDFDTSGHGCQVYSVPEIPLKGNEPYAYMEQKCITDEVLDQIIGECGLSMKSRKGVHKVEHTVVKRKIVPTGTMELGVCAASHGIGATYTSILCAQSLSLEYKVAYVEQNGSGHMRCLLETLNKNIGEDAEGGIFSYQGVDYYFGMDYLQFATGHRNAYDFVVADFGFLDTELAIQEFCRMNKHFVVVPHVPWRKGDISSCCEWVQQEAHMEDAVYLTPYAVSSGLRRQIDAACDSEEIQEVGYVADAFRPGQFQQELFYRLCGVTEEEVQKEAKLFQRIKRKLSGINLFA